MRKVVRLFLFVSLMAMVLAGCAAPAADGTEPTQPASEPAAEGEYQLPAKITVGVNSENPPWIYMDNGDFAGFEVDILREFGRRKGIEVEFKSAPFSTVLTGVQSGQWDVAASSIWIKPERAEVMDFADPYYDAQIGMLTNKNAPLGDFSNMKGKTFGADGGSANESWLKEAMERYGPYEIKSYDYWTDGIMDLEAGRLAGVVLDAPQALYYVMQHPDSNLMMELYIDDYHYAQAIAFQKGSPLTAIFNEVQDEMKQDGFLAELHRKYFGADPLPDSSTVNKVPPYMPNEKPEL